MNDTSYVKTEPAYYGRPCRSFKIFSWSAVFAGALVGVGLSFLFNLLNLALGFFALTTDSGRDIDTLAVGGIIWLLICAIITMFFTGWVSGKVAKCCFYKRSLGILHGFCAWCVALIFSLFILSHIGALFASSTDNESTNSSNPATMLNKNQTSPVTVSDNQVAVNKDVANVSGKGAFGIFLIFLVGAVSSCIGGFIGIGTQPRVYSSTAPTDKVIP